jgi:quercetin dioxygenase-like cupin family protein
VRRTVGSIVVVALGVLGFASVGESESTGVNRTVLARGQAASDYTIKGAGGTDVVAVKATIEPGATAPWHSRTGPEAAIVVSGTLTLFSADDPKCAPREYQAGEVLIGTSTEAHQVKNLGKEPVELVITYFDVPAGGHVHAPAQRPSNCPE